ncbi:SGNH/GDSL hydrolase family protein [Paenibacillus ginsengarvi]|uniref:SGNH hydrolase-type esterase domain-containing protein n=1 Tax=Paenibacillus ginsengarvi TaxID=400777 RepID=A0A3B0CYL2_9BACL|nr:GDSL-type esterase/lipase family protein [Paenibacillus ginsengarvi]RKN86736.1 hypothetical protein D7M11_01910 [Paenibacillus ginsengarvi]
MANRYANLVGSKKISEDFGNINIGFDRVQQDVDQIKQDVTGLDFRVDNIVGQTGESNTEIVDARMPSSGSAYSTLKDRLDNEHSDLTVRVNDNANNVVSDLAKRLQAGQVTKIRLIGHSIVAGLGAMGSYVPPSNPIIFNDGAGTIYRESDYTSRCWANFFREYIGSNFPSVSFTNAGISGQTVAWGLANAQYWMSNNEDVVFVMLSSNDRMSSSLAQYKSNMEQFLAYVNARCKTMIVLTENPPTDDYAEDGTLLRNFSTDAIDRVLTQICNEKGYAHVSFYREMVQYMAETDDKHLTEWYRNAHPNDAGYYLMWNILQTKLGLGDRFYKMRKLAKRKVYNAIIDGNFQIAQAKPIIGMEAVNPAFNSYPVFDMWKLTGFVGSGDSLPTIKHSQRRITDAGSAINAIPGARRTYFIEWDGPGSTANSQYNIVQRIENGVSRLAAHSTHLNMSFGSRSSVVGKKIQMTIVYNYGTGGSPSPTDFLTGQEFTITSTFQEYPVSIPNIDIRGKTFGTNNDDYIEVQWKLAGGFQNFVAAGNFELASARFNPFGPTPPLIDESFDDALRSCQRYYEKSFPYFTAVGQNVGNPGSLTYIKNIAGQYNSGVYVQYKVKKRHASAVVTFYNPNATNGAWRNTSTSTDSGEAYAAYAGDNGFLAVNPGLSSETGAADVCIVHWTADCRL